jgi:hypothetical protein
VQDLLPKGVTGLVDEIEGPAFASTVGSVIHGSKVLASDTVLSFDKSSGKMSGLLSKIVSKIKSFLP